MPDLSTHIWVAMYDKSHDLKHFKYMYNLLQITEGINYIYKDKILLDHFQFTK